MHYLKDVRWLARQGSINAGVEVGPAAIMQAQSMPRTSVQNPRVMDYIKAEVIYLLGLFFHVHFQQELN
jgi:hypothetical protein